MRRRTFFQTGAFALARAADIPAKLVVLTFDDVVKSHRSFAAPLLKKLGFGTTAAGVRSRAENRWILTEWDRCGRTWGYALCPCLHFDPVLPDCAPGQTVRVAGRLWFSEGHRPAIA